MSGDSAADHVCVLKDFATPPLLRTRGIQSPQDGKRSRWEVGRSMSGAERRGGERVGGGNVLITEVDTVQMKRNCLGPRTGRKANCNPDVGGVEARL